MEAKIEVLRQRITELEAENAKIKAEKADLEARDANLRREFAEHVAEKAELKRRIAEVLRQAGGDNKKRDAENTELKSRVGELEARLAIVEQNTVAVGGQSQNDNSPGDRSSNFNSVCGVS
jgi:chromosome segregation ATPase